MNDREALMQAIIDNPDDDLPRLVFADWLEEQGQADRAELIRCQCWLSMTKENHHPDRLKWQKRQLYLYRELKKQLRNEIPKCPGVNPRDFLRGFYYSLGIKGCPIGDGLAKVASIFHSAPITKVTIVFGWLSPISSGYLFGLEELNRIRTIHLEGWYPLPTNSLTKSPLECFSLCPYLRELRSLEIAIHPFPESDQQLLARWPQLSQLTELSLSSHNASSQLRPEILASASDLHPELKILLYGTYGLEPSIADWRRYFGNRVIFKNRS
jgi:uncharacterized protein (TIGR02996 family)